ncbi:MAG: hypothetical protein ACLFQR_05185 [Desulfovibrionales bacterium]
MHRSGHFPRTEELLGLQVDILLCGALSKVMEFTLLGAGIRIEKCLRGETEEVLQTFLQERSSMGRGGNRRRNRHGFLAARRTACHEVMEQAPPEGAAEDADEAGCDPDRAESASAPNAEKNSRTCRDSPALK